MICTVVVSKDDDMYIAKDLRTNIADQGETAEKALSNLKEALELYYDGNGIVESVVIK
ncbi:MAG: type II toxin-antitoxin system HicB family antitoxin [Lachnospiraceae bacterium]|nr:type II toxin-antitoxin system HicB family antitoxin [Lachnospiraceae bacterium]